MKNGQNVVLFAPRRYGKSSLVLRAAQEAVAAGVLVGYCDLMRTPTKERFAAALAKTIWEDIAPPGAQIAERATIALPRPPAAAVDGDRRRYRQPPLQLRRRPAAADRRHRRHDRAPPGAAAGSRERAGAPRRLGARRVPGDRQARPQLPEPDAGRLPDAARGGARLSRQQAARARLDFQRPERAVLAECQAAWRSARSRPPSSGPSSGALRRHRQGHHRPRARQAARGDRRPPLRDAGARVLRLGARLDRAQRARDARRGCARRRSFAPSTITSRASGTTRPSTSGCSCWRSPRSLGRSTLASTRAATTCARAVTCSGR